MGYEFRDLRAHTDWVRGVAWVIAMTTLANVGVDAWFSHEMRLVLDHRIEDLATFQMMLHGASLLQTILNVIVYSLLLLNIVLFCIWLHRAACNLRALGAVRLAYTPGWTVGWFFVPFANLVMPYRTVREVWLASDEPKRWSEYSHQPLLIAWWGGWILAGLIHRFAQSDLGTAHGPADLLPAAYAEMTGMLVFAGVALLFAHWVGRVWSMQARSYGRQLDSIPALPEAAAA